MKKAQVDYSLYLVTDSTEAILGSRNLADVVEQALRGGVTIVQYRDKTSDTADLISTAKALHARCKAHDIPLLINDRVDVALAVDCEGVHLGQDDMSIASARAILGPDKIIGATVSSVDEAKVAVERGADYLGIGTLYATNTKKNTKDIIGINGVREILDYLGSQQDEASKGVKTVCIGGINASNIQLITYLLSPPSTPYPLSGVAIVSAIIAAPDVLSSTRTLKSLITAPPPFAPYSTSPGPSWRAEGVEEMRFLVDAIPRHITAVHSSHSLSHNMTNLVVQNFAANIALALGASPIMSNNGLEAADLARLHGGLVINMGTATPDALHNHRLAIAAYNAAGGPIVLDPVGAGATSARREALAFLLASGYFDVIKGNEREISAVARASGFTVEDTSQQRGVDSGTALLTLAQKATTVSRLARRLRNIILLTGPVDVISDGAHTYTVANGHAYLGLVTGTGCTLGTTLSAYLAAERQSGAGYALFAAIAGLVHFEVAAEDAARRVDVQGPGTFVPAFIDEVWKRGRDVVEGRAEWVGERVRVECVRDVTEEGG
ncbi:Hydroxyethylthiazole kinase family-domain-containing protein [Massariosphaeria phaeospora]|uniref:Hydroxyethylthiazole kinase family-domain-containing protein n=1 Tax=Massariosphaeria phaeospora TaxID=100035 RepID=A0A7C8I5C8_9PLEO|nr:Hydroxyethylthiazole kinase family-domain-containing protein [Massariosphaeria phaeospora]